MKQLLGDKYDELVDLRQVKLVVPAVAAPWTSSGMGSQSNIIDLEEDRQLTTCRFLPSLYVSKGLLIRRGRKTGVRLNIAVYVMISLCNIHVFDLVSRHLCKGKWIRLNR